MDRSIRILLAIAMFLIAFFITSGVCHGFDPTYPEGNDVFNPQDVRCMQIVGIHVKPGDRALFVMKDALGTLWETMYVHTPGNYVIGDVVITGWCPDLIILCLSNGRCNEKKKEVKDMHL